MEADSSPATAARRSRRHLRVGFWLTAIVVGCLQAWLYRNVVENDTISHLDMADAFLRGDWSAAVSGYWNPLYAWLLALALWIARPSPYWEYPTVHFVLFAAFLFALVCFEFFLRELIRFHARTRKTDSSGEDDAAAPSILWMALGYALFLWSSLSLIGLGSSNPDMLVAAFVYVAAGLLLRIRSGNARWTDFAWLGLALGLGYLTKQIMFPLAFVFIAVGTFSAGHLRRAIPVGLVALATFLLVSAPLVIALYGVKGRVTFGESGKFAYAVLVNEVAYRHWQGEEAGSGTPLHPTRKIFSDPATFEFDRPIQVTYPLWYDITYWYDGLKIHFDFARQAKVVWNNLSEIKRDLLGLNGGLITGFLVLLFASSARRSILKDFSAYWFLIVPALAGLGLYSLTLVLDRYVAPFLVLLISSAFWAAGARALPEKKGVLAGVTAALWFMLALELVPDVYAAAGDLAGRRGADPHPYWQVAEELKKMGLRPGDKVASISYANVNNVKWARLARAKIVAEVYHSIYEPEKNDFWKARPTAQQEIIRALAKTGARVIVSDEEPRGPGAAGWRRIGDTNYFAHFPSGSFLLRGNHASPRADKSKIT
ncbi:MAG TPA: hypothetical protein VGL11_15755 [Candidatus Binatia bacterium]|jgi:hypothetical protein